MAINKIVRGLKDAVRHARCVNHHVDQHVTTVISKRERAIKCMKCGHAWREQDRYDGREPFTLTTYT